MQAGPKKAQLEHSAFTACNYSGAEPRHLSGGMPYHLGTGPAVKERVWHLFADAPEPLGYDPGGIGVPGWDGPSSPAFSVLRLIVAGPRADRRAAGHRQEGGGVAAPSQVLLFGLAPAALAGCSCQAADPT